MSDSAAKTWLSSHDNAIPALDGLHRKAIQTLNRKTASLTDLADVIALDPGMSVALFDRVNANRSGHKRPRLDSIQSLLGLLGTPAVTDFVRQYKTLSDLALSNEIRQAYHQLISRNFHLMYQATQLIELQGMETTNEICAAATLHNVGEIYACLFDAKTYQRYQQAFHSSKNQFDSAEPIFGFSFKQLGALIADKKHLPDLACESQMQSTKTGRKARSIQFAAQITQQTEKGWNHDALEKSFAEAARFLGTSTHNLRSKLLSVALDAARDCPVDDVFPAIARVILLPSIEPVVATAPAKIARTSAYGDKLKALIKYPRATQANVIELVVNELFEGLNFSRVALMLTAKDNSVITTRMSKGLGVESPLLKLQINMAQSGLIKNLLAKPQSLWVSSANFKKYEPLLPGVFRASCQSENFFLMSLFNGDKPIGLVFCDCTRQLNETLYQQFKSHLMLTGKALGFLAQRRQASA